MSTLTVTRNFLGPIPETTDEYLLKVLLGDHHPFQVTAGEEMAEVYPLEFDASPLPAFSEEPRHALVKIKCPKLKAINLVVKDPENEDVSFTEVVEPVLFSEDDVIPEEHAIHVFYDLSEDAQHPSIDAYTILPGRRTRTIHR